MLAIVLAGTVGAAGWFRMGWREEQERAEAELTRRVQVRHAVVKEVLHSYEDSLFALTSLFVREGTFSRTGFIRASKRMSERLAGAQAFEWVPLVTAAERPAVEAAGRAAYAPRDFRFLDFDEQGQASPAAERPFYYPICQVEPLAGNEAALGFDLSAGGSRRAFLDLARSRGQLVVTGSMALVQDRSGPPGIVMIMPVNRPTGEDASDAHADEFVGFVLSVFRVREILPSLPGEQAEPVVDALFVDAAETDSSRRVLFFRPAEGASADLPPPTESEFRSAGPVRQLALPFGERDWQVLYRPKRGWIEQQHTNHPLLRSSSVLLFAGLMAGLVGTLGRRTQTIRREVAERTAELAESRRRLAGLLHALPGMAFRCVYREQLILEFVSDGVRELTGWSVEELLAGTPHFRDLIHPDDLLEVRDATRRAMRDRVEFSLEYRIRTRVGEERWVLCRGHGVYNERGDLDAVEGLAIDITARKSAEQVRLDLERKLLEGQKLESLGLLAGGIAHDFNNLLSTILGNANILRASDGLADAATNQVRAIELASMRAAELCRQMLAYAGQGRFVVEPTDVTALVNELLPLLEISVARQGGLRRHLPSDLPAVMADATQLRQIVMNLVLNAADAIGDGGGEIAVSTGVMPVAEALLAGCVAGAGLRAGNYVFVEVRDTGAGMTPEVMARIFDPFFTTKFAGRGLGLAAVLGIVRGHGGALRVTSSPGAGSAFRLLLPPVTLALPPAQPSASASPFRWKRAGAVLVIEDEDPVRAVVMEMLKSFGLTPTGASGGAEGLACFRNGAAPFDLVMLDVLMPVMNGEQTYAALREIDAQVPVLLMSGYSQGDILARLKRGGSTAFLAKPFTREAFERKLREMLG